MATKYSPRIVNDGLILCLDAGNPKSYTSGSSTWYDTSGKGNDFTIQGNLTWSPYTGFGNFTGNSTGTGNKIYRSSFPTNLKSYQGGNGLTVMVWAQSTGGANAWRKLIGNGDGENYIDLYQASSSPYGWHTNGSGELLYYNNGIAVSSDVLALNDSVWRLLIATNLWGGTTTNPSYGLTIGNEPNSSPLGTNAYPWVGNIASVWLYDRVLSPTEMTQNYNATKRRFGL
jgi:hypothetical protein